MKSFMYRYGPYLAIVTVVSTLFIAGWAMDADPPAKVPCTFAAYLCR